MSVNARRRPLLSLALCAALLATVIIIYRLIGPILTPSELETILSTYPTTQEDLWEAIAAVSAERRLDVSAEALARMDRDAKIYLELRLRDDPSLVDRIVWFRDGFTIDDAHHFDVVGTRDIWGYHFTAAPPDSYVILLDRDRNILGWVPPK